MSTNQENPTLNRLEEQIDWYDKKSALNQSCFKGIKIIEIVAAALIPLLAGLSALVPSPSIITIMILPFFRNGHPSRAKIIRKHEQGKDPDGRYILLCSYGSKIFLIPSATVLRGIEILKLIVALMLFSLLGSAAALQLGGSSGQAILADLQNESSDLWTWGAAPAGRMLLNNTTIDGGVVTAADLSAMETPTEAAGLAIAPQSGPDGGAYIDKKYYGSSAKGIFDCTCMKAPALAQFPRVYV